MTDLNTTQQQTKFKILLIGDDCVDVYQYGTVDRISPEAPVPVFKYSNEVFKPGMAANVKANLESLGCDVSYMHGDTSTKTRLIDIRSKQQIVRIDNDVMSKAIDFSNISSSYDAVVISDYNKGTVSYELIEVVRKNFAGPVFVDTKKTDVQRVEGCYVKVNQLEYSKLTSKCSTLITTLGSDGAEFMGQVYTAPRVDVSDVTGAGDTFLAALTYQYIDTGDIEKAIRFANTASAVTVQHLGVYAPTLKEMG
jgi:D-beta-D-heptose 7-phosphate kinase/D-beta-D-heptose 1-phosphate adenosyltransferase